jgi:hypothetical protein
MLMTPASNGCKYIVQGRDVLSGWPEGQALTNETGRLVAQFMFNDVCMRWGCPEEIITDNSAIFLMAVAWLARKYGIRGITISPANSKANGKAERMHWDMRISLAKATENDLSKWWWYLPIVRWADRITIRKGLGCSPYFIVTGAHPITPLDIVEATWLVKLPNRVLTTEELIGYRARALAKHQVHVEDMRRRIAKMKRSTVEDYEKRFRRRIKDYKFNKGDLVLVRNTDIESSHDRKMYPRYLGPMVVLRRNPGGNYIIAELDGSVYHARVAAFKVVPYYARHAIELPDDLEEWTGIPEDQLAEIPSEKAKKASRDELWFEDQKLRPIPEDVAEEMEEDDDSEEDFDLGPDEEENCDGMIRT